MTRLTPDTNANGFLDAPPAPARYDTAGGGPDDVAYKIAARLPKGARVLDVGCGTGVVSELLKKLSGCDITAIEPEPARAAIARSRGLKVIEGYLTENLTAELGRFDAIVFADVLEHLSDPAAMLVCASLFLAPNGFIFASVPNAAHWTLRMDLLRGRFNYEDCGIMDATHLRWFTHASLKSFFERLGFEVLFLDQTRMDYLPAYNRRWPWKWMPGRVKRNILRVLICWFPKVFGCQIIIQARLKPPARQT